MKANTAQIYNKKLLFVMPLFKSYMINVRFLCPNVVKAPIIRTEKILLF